MFACYADDVLTGSNDKAERHSLWILGVMGSQLTVFSHASSETLVQPAGWAMAPLGPADLTASSKGAGETRMFVDGSSVRNRDAVRVSGGRVNRWESGEMNLSELCPESLARLAFPRGHRITEESLVDVGLAKHWNPCSLVLCYQFIQCCGWQS